MISGTYILSGSLLLISAALFYSGVPNAVTRTICWCVIFFVASTGARSAYLTVSEIFPLEVRAKSFAQMRREAAARADAVVEFRRQPPAPPKCPVVLLSAGRVPRGAGKHLTDIQEHQRQYVDSLENARFETVDSMHIIQAEQPELVSARIREFLPAS
ncbi:alpha/beta fold hydrolase [Nocardia albiluteola]|nr:hypothetical protein [Nocardia albiluteola]